jgi:hypothetical protein
VASGVRNSGRDVSRVCRRRAWLAEAHESPEGEFLLCTDCGEGATKGCICHSVCRSCGNDDLIELCPVAWSEDGDRGQPV